MDGLKRMPENPLGFKYRPIYLHCIALTWFLVIRISHSSQWINFFFFLFNIKGVKNVQDVSLIFQFSSTIAIGVSPGGSIAPWGLIAPYKQSSNSVSGPWGVTVREVTPTSPFPGAYCIWVCEEGVVVLNSECILCPIKQTSSLLGWCLPLALSIGLADSRWWNLS